MTTAELAASLTVEDMVWLAWAVAGCLVAAWIFKILGKAL